jgi:hypothetical protein
VGIRSQESSSSSGNNDRQAQSEEEDDGCGQHPVDTGAAILQWAQAQGLRRRRADGGFGLPDESLLREWTEILTRFCPVESDRADWARAVLDNAKSAADRASDWRNWAFLTLQVQLAAERTSVVVANPLCEVSDTDALPAEDPNCEWARAKQLIRAEIGGIPFANWFDLTRQTSGDHASITVALPNSQTKEFVEMDYLPLIQRACSVFGVSQVHLTVDQAVLGKRAELQPSSSGDSGSMNHQQRPPMA